MRRSISVHNVAVKYFEHYKPVFASEKSRKSGDKSDEKFSIDKADEFVVKPSAA